MFTKKLTNHWKTIAEQAPAFWSQVISSNKFCSLLKIFPSNNWMPSVKVNAQFEWARQMSTEWRVSEEDGRYWEKLQKIQKLKVKWKSARPKILSLQEEAKCFKFVPAMCCPISGHSNYASQLSSGNFKRSLTNCVRRFLILPSHRRTCRHGGLQPIFCHKHCWKGLSPSSVYCFHSQHRQ